MDAQGGRRGGQRPPRRVRRFGSALRIFPTRAGSAAAGARGPDDLGMLLMGTGTRLPARPRFAAGIALVCCSAAVDARADDDSRSLSTSASAYSQYIFRGLTQTNGHPALQGAAEYASTAGLYAGSWLSNISWFSDSNAGIRCPVEWDIYGGYRRSLGNGVAIDVGVLRYAYPGRYGTLPEGTTSPNMTELFIGASWRTSSVKYSYSVTNNGGIEHSVGSGYLELNVTVPAGKAFKTILHLGRQEVRGQNALAERLGTSNKDLYTYNDYSVALAATVRRSWSASVAYTGTTARDAGYRVQGRNLGSPHLVVGLTDSF